MANPDDVAVLRKTSLLRLRVLVVAPELRQAWADVIDWKTKQAAAYRASGRMRRTFVVPSGVTSLIIRGRADAGGGGGGPPSPLAVPPDDALHPTQEGYQRIAGAMAGTVQAMTQPVVARPFTVPVVPGTTYTLTVGDRGE